MCTLNIVPEREECVASQRHVCHLIQPCSLLLCCKDIRFHLEYLFPSAVRQYIHVFVPDIEIDRVVAVRTSDAVHKLKSQHLWGLA